MEIGVYSFAELRGDAASAEQRLRNLIEEIELAEAVGLDVFGQHEPFGHERFLGQISVGDLAHDKVLRAIELLGTKVAPAVRAQIG